MTDFVKQSIEFLIQSGIQGSVDKKAEGPCVICDALDSVMNSHHTVPRSCGGNSSLQVSLCATDHDILHANANAVLAAQRKNKSVSKQFWHNKRKEERAQPLLNVLLASLVQNVGSEEALNRNLISSNISLNLKKALDSLAKDLKMSKSNAVAYCLIYTLTEKGILNEKLKREELNKLR